MNILLLSFENSRLTSPAQENNSPANMNLCNRFLRGFIFDKNRMIRTGMISALVINPGQKPGRFRKMILISPIIK